MHHSHVRTFLVAALIATILPFNGFSILVAQAATTTIVVAPHNLETSTDLGVAGDNDNWFFYNDEYDAEGNDLGIDNTLGSFVTGPATVPAGSGSVQISVSGTQRRNLATYQFRGTPLADITTLKFSTYNPSAGNGGGANRSGYLGFNVSFDGTDTWQKRLIYGPSDNGAVQQDTWQEWDAINNGNAIWHWSGGTPWPGGVTNTAGYVGANRTWADILADFPNARIRATDSFLGIRVGSPYPDGYTENIDAFKFGVSGNETVFDFEPETPCTAVCYVDAVNGNDAFGGDTITSAKKTTQAAVNQVNAGGTVLVAAGTYEEQVTIGKSLTLVGTGAATTIIQAPAGLLPPEGENSNIVKIAGADVSVELSGFTITGPGAGRGIFVRDGAYANIHDNLTMSD